jgi:translation elongation factor EF-1alpha
MIIGISQADIAILVAPVSSKYFGDSETCTQTKEYSLMAFSLGVKNIIVVVNKMDDPTVNYSSDLYLSTK